MGGFSGSQSIESLHFYPRKLRPFPCCQKRALYLDWDSLMASGVGLVNCFENSVPSCFFKRLTG